MKKSLLSCLVLLSFLLFNSCSSEDESTPCNSIIVLTQFTVMQAAHQILPSGCERGKNAKELNDYILENEACIRKGLIESASDATEEAQLIEQFEQSKEAYLEEADKLTC
ncbi:hypothetical protein [Flammeovirga aprica]|uniref:Uncharacterized protein n=1 Tax=Flammeovirga aprica JL-4 TaxID=694437 RepID=A0A7X9RYI3_9BACT|nr:hypothetical protein [Flammeovirga aprica]NME71085.1 hypothetical protein [Flammeovirga aprica JL-4]